MENIDVTVLRALRDWRQAGHGAILVTVVRTWGSSPRPVGSIMALRADGAVTGSVSGGCIEDDMIARYTQPGVADALPHAARDGARRLTNSDPVTPTPRALRRWWIGSMPGSWCSAASAWPTAASR